MANTKIPSELSNTPSISDSGNATAITIDSSERVGIGTTSPDDLLHVFAGDSTASASTLSAVNIEKDDDVALTFMTPNDKKAQIRFADPQDTGNGIIAYDHNTASMQFATNGPEKMRIDSSGNVGINDSSPSSGSSSLVTLNIGGAIMTKNTANASTNYVFESRYSGSNNLTLGYKGNGSTHTASVIGSQNNLPLSIEVGGSERFKIDSSGNITTPSNPAFDVADSSGTSQGNTKAFGTVYVNRGSHYSTSNGRFTAPIAGTYLFYMSYIKNGSLNVHRRGFIKNGSTTDLFPGGRQLRLDSDSTGGQSYGDNGYLIMMTTLAANDYIQVYQQEGTSYGAVAYEVFGGYLIG